MFLFLYSFLAIWLYHGLIKPINQSINLLKRNSPISPSDTRPIANLCEMSKIFVRIVHREMTEFIVANDLLDPRQSG